MLLAADAGMAELTAMPIATAATPTDATSFWIFTLTPFLCPRCIQRGRYPGVSVCKRNLPQSHAP
jgi:hypothetical protein